MGGFAAPTGFGLFVLLVVGGLPTGAPATHAGALPRPSATVTVWGKVLDGLTHQPVPNAKVVPAGGPAVPSAANGFYAVNVSAGRVSFQVSAPGYHNSSYAVNATGVSYESNFTVQPFTFGIHGAVVDASTQLGLPGATVTVAVLNLSVVTTALGNFRVAVENGSFTVSAAASGYVPESMVVAVNGSPVPQYFLLQRATGPGPVNRSSGGLPPGPLLLLGVGAGGIAALAGYGLAVRAREQARRRAAPLAGLPAERDAESAPTLDIERRRALQRRR